jgi:hypothetical protein
MQWQTITKMSESPLFPANFIANTLKDNIWTVSEPLGHLGTGFWYDFFIFSTTNILPYPNLNEGYLT